jgi:trans-aconitate methyltransferase
MTATNQRWDAALYDARHGFVWKHGASLVELLAPHPGERVLDLGCGTGHLTAQIAAAGATVVGLDHSNSMLAQARATHPGLEFVYGDARYLAFSMPFDAVFSNAVLHWIPDAALVIRSVCRSLKVGGRFVAEFGGRNNVRELRALLRRAAEGRQLRFVEPPWYFPSVSEYASLLESEGMEVGFATLFDRPTPLDGADGLRNWVRQFFVPTLEAIPAAEHDVFLAGVEDAARHTLFHEGGWVADYRRLRVVAVRVV